ncbi:MAG: type I restriction endonuclease subunit R, partial [Chlorobiaceae bacterium]|nr:type I restriction endonuclease subunit R [Chlorobiaceae bacterium]
MNGVGQAERETQNRVIALFRDELDYRYLEDWTDREGNSNIEEPFLSSYLKRKGYNQDQISRALHRLHVEADNPNRSLYENNREVYSLLRYGVQVRTAAGELTDTIHLIDWNHPDENDFALAEEVTLRGNRERRPDIVLYINGIAIGVLELKNSRIA